MAVVLVFCLFLRKFFKGFPRAKKLKILFRVSWGNSASKEAEPGFEVFELEIVSQFIHFVFMAFHNEKAFLFGVERCWKNF